MMTPRGTATRRMWVDLVFQYRAWRMAIDWTVALYLVVPGLFFAGYQYVSWYRELPVWMEPVPFGAARAALYVWAISGTLRVYVLEADQLFLAQRTTWFQRMMGWGASLSLARSGLMTAMAGVVLYPLLSRAYGFGIVGTVLLFVVVGLFQAYMMLGQMWLALRFHGWLGVLVRGLALAPAGIVFALVTGGIEGGLVSMGWLTLWAVVLAAPLHWAVRARIRMRGAFYYDVRREQQEKMKVAAMLLSMGGIEGPKKARLRRKKPLLFSASGRLFRQRAPENVLAESLIKAGFRSSSNLKLMGYSFLVYAGAVTVSPSGGYRYAVLAAVCLLYVYMCRGFAKDGANEAFVRLFHWRDGVRFDAFQKACAGLALPACVLLAGWAGVLEQGAAGVILLPLGAAVAWGGAFLFALGGSGERGR